MTIVYEFFPTLTRNLTREAVSFVEGLRCAPSRPAKNRFLTTLFVVLGSLCNLTIASAATITVPGMQPDIQSAINVSSPGDQVLVAPGTYVVGTTINVTVANLTIQGSGISSTTLQVAQAVGNMFSVQAAGTGATIRDFKIQKTDLAGLHELIWINANNVTVRDNEIFGPDPGVPWSVAGIVSRAMIVSPGLTGLLIQGNNIHHLRQPAYIDGPPGVIRGSILGNHVSGTRGWVLDGAKMVISGNTWGPPQNQGAEIALINSSTPVDYPNLIALSNANNNAYISAQWVGGENGRATAYVDDSAAPGGFGSIAAPYQTVGAGVANTLTSGTVQVAAGSYTEQVVVGKNMSIQGAGVALTTIQSPLVLTTFFTTPGPNNNYPVVVAQNSTDIRIRDLTVDGAGRGSGNYRFQGIGFWNAGGKILNCDVLGIRETPFNGNQHGVAVYANNNTGGPYALEVGLSNLTDWQKNGTVLAGSGLTVNMHDCVVTGQGATGLNAENGIQVSGVTAGSITNCAVSGCYYTGPSVTATGHLFFGPGSVNVTGGSVTGCQAGTYYIDASGTMANTNTTTPVGGGIGSWGVVTYNSSASIVAQMRTGDAGQVRPVAQPWDDGGAAFARTSTNATNSLVTLNINGGCITGPGTAASNGVDIYTEGGGLAVNVTNMEISNWGYGIAADGTSGGPAVNANHNAITGNITGGYFGGLGSHLAEFNWWGNAGGPGVGGANPVVGVVDVTPRLIAGTDANAGCGFAPPADNTITPVAPLVCVTPANPCVDVPVNIARTTSDGLRAFSVDVLLSSGLTICAPVDEGSYLSSVGGTQFQVLNNGGGSYTIDCSILGLPCGATAATGTLFTLHLGSLLPSATGTVTITAITLRDCANAGVAGTAGAPASISIDNTAPAAIAVLAAAQQRTGNDADGTTKINVSWPAVEAGASVLVYRKGFGFYPEYDDAGGAAPATPSYPPVGWTLAGTVTGPVSFADETTVRDFYYYVAFVKDACGNISAVSNRTGGTLNYELGDVQPVAVLRGNNLVNTADVSNLGINYGITLVFNDALNYLDVGPTTDFSVNARPTTDNRVQFEDLMMFAINYGQVSSPAMVAKPAGKEGSEQLELGVPELPAVGETFAVSLTLSSPGTVKGVSVQLAYDPAIIEPAGVEAGELLTGQHVPSVVLSASSGNVDAALLGTGEAIAGRGELARALFRVKARGDAGIRMASVLARDKDNRALALGSLSTPAGNVAPARTALGMAFPNPFENDMTIELALRHESEVTLDVYDLSGRRVANVLNGTQPAGMRLVKWDGRGERGVRLAPGIYLMRLDADGVRQTRRVMLVP